MVGSMITAPLLSLFVRPAIYKLLGPKRLAKAAGQQPAAEPDFGMTPITQP